MDQKSLVRWVNDQLHSIVGYSNSGLAEYLVSLGGKAKDPQFLLQKLISSEIPDKPETHSFATQLFDKANQQRQNNDNKTKAKEMTNADLVRLSERYSLVDMTQDNTEPQKKSKHKSKDKDKDRGKDRKSDNKGKE